MKIFGGPRKRAPGLIVVGAATLSLVVAGAANAVVFTTPDALYFAQQVVSDTSLTGAAYSVNYPCVNDDPATTTLGESLCPMGVGNTPLAGFPTAGSNYGVLTTGNAAYADDANAAADTGYGWNVSGNPPIGAGVYDYQIAKIDMGAATTSCLAFDFRFMSDEYPEFVDTNYNDAFIAQLNTWTVSADPATQTVTAPGNFAGGAGDVISVDAGGPSAMVDSTGLGVTYDGATALLTARIPVVPGSTNSVYLTIFDQGDAIYDSAVFVDNLHYENIGAAQCKSLSADPYDGTTGTNPVAGSGPKLSKKLDTLSVKLECNLPPGPVSCPVAGSASFAPTPGRTVSDRQAALLAQMVVAKGSATIPPNTVGTLTMKTTKSGVKALKAAIQKPAKLKAKAKALLKKAKKLRAAGKIAEAKKLEKKAAKLIKRAKALAKKPLGTIKLKVTNSVNGVTQTFTYKLPRP